MTEENALEQGVRHARIAATVLLVAGTFALVAGWGAWEQPDFWRTVRYLAQAIALAVAAIAVAAGATVLVISWLPLRTKPDGGADDES